MNTKISTIIIFTPRMEQLADFYQKGLGLGEAQRQGEDHIGFEMPNLYLGFDQDASWVDAGKSRVTCWFEVDDLPATFAKLVEMGGQVRYPPTAKPWGATLAAVWDPEENMIGLSQRQA